MRSNAGEITHLGGREEPLGVEEIGSLPPGVEEDGLAHRLSEEQLVGRMQPLGWEPSQAEGEDWG